MIGEDILSGLKKDALKIITEELDLNLPSKATVKIIKENILEKLEKEDIILGRGELEVMYDGYGFLRETSIGEDIYVSASQIRKFKLRSGDGVLGVVKLAKEGQNRALLKVLQVNNDTLEKATERKPFDELTPIYPDEHLKLESGPKDRVGRMIDLIAPIGKGQRGIIIAPPKTGKTILMSNIANAIIKNHQEVEVWILLIDERPEEVTDIKEVVKGAAVFASTFDEDPQNHLKVTEAILEKAKRQVEDGKDIVILMDSITRLARAYNTVIPSSGKIISGGIDPAALYYPKKFLGAARNIKGGGSLTIIATALIGTGSKMDDVIYEEFKGTGNLDIQLDRKLAQLRIYPSIEISLTSTRKEELLIGKEKLESIWNLRRNLLELDKVTATKKMIEIIEGTKTNDELLEKFTKGENK